jgi:act minimal PKS chain-length factor (CLF/KS beta)
MAIPFYSWAAIVGQAATFDPRLGSGREPGLRRAMELALADAGLTGADIDVLSADAAGVPELDRLEAAVICSSSARPACRSSRPRR